MHHHGYFTEIKPLVKKALQSGKIKRKVESVNSPPLCTSDYVAPNDFSSEEKWRSFLQNRSDNRWAEFENFERLFRNSIRTKDEQNKTTFAHNDYRQWLRLFNKVNNFFCCDGVFNGKKKNGQDFKLQTLKYMWRVICKFPIEISEINETDSDRSVLLGKIEEALHFIDRTIFPSLRKQHRLASGRPRHEARRVERAELTQLWSQNQKRAIDIIKNDSVVEARATCPIETDTLTTFFQEKSDKRLQYPLPPPPWPDNVNPPPPQLPVTLGPFTVNEVSAVVRSLKNNTAPGYDGVEYRYLKRNINKIGNILTAIFNVCWCYRKIPQDWKHATITLLPKKGGNPQQPGDWRPISLLTSFYKIYMKLIQSRMLPWIVSTDRLSKKQKGSLPRNGLQEHVFCLKAAIDNFKHMSTKFYTTFVDIKDAYGSVDHKVMLDAMERAGYPQQIIDITTDVYTNSTFQVQTKGGLTPKITRHRGIVQGCPWSAIAFIQALDPWIRWMEQPFPIDSFPTPCQAYMDDVCASAHNDEAIKLMMEKTETFLNYTGMEVKHKKCATIHGQRTGNNWSARDNTRQLNLKAQGEVIPQYGKERSYPYLGYQVNLAGTASKQQLDSIWEEFQSALDKIAIAPLPLNRKIEAVNIIVSSKLNFYYSNVQFTEKLLNQLESRIVGFVRETLKLNTSSTRSQIFTPRKQGGLGLLKPTTMYHAKRVSFLLSVLNSDDQHVRAVARSSFKLHMSKRKAQEAEPDADSFGGYKVDDEMRLQKQSKVNWPRSVFVELNELCIRLNMRLEFDEHADSYMVLLPASDDGIIQFRFTNPQQLYSAIKKKEIDRDLQYWQELQQQGRLQRETLPFADMASSVGHLTNTGINDHLTRFVTKGRLQLLETSAVKNTYYPQTYSKECPLCGFFSDTNSHALNGCRKLKGLYTERHDRCVKLVKVELQKSVFTENCELFENQCVSVDDRSNLESNKPDLCFIDHGNSVAFIIEVSNPFDPFIEDCYHNKFQKYMPLCMSLCDAGFQTKVIVLVVGSLGTVHRKLVPGLSILGLSKSQSKALAKYLSISVMIGSRRAWARRGYLVEAGRR